MKRIHSLQEESENVAQQESDSDWINAAAAIIFVCPSLHHPSFLQRAMWIGCDCSGYILLVEVLWRTSLYCSWGEKSIFFVKWVLFLILQDSFCLCIGLAQNILVYYICYVLLIFQILNQKCTAWAGTLTVLKVIEWNNKKLMNWIE